MTKTGVVFYLDSRRSTIQIEVNFESVLRKWFIPDLLEVDENGYLCSDSRPVFDALSKIHIDEVEKITFQECVYYKVWNAFAGKNLLVECKIVDSPENKE